MDSLTLLVDGQIPHVRGVTVSIDHCHSLTRRRRRQLALTMVCGTVILMLCQTSVKMNWPRNIRSRHQSDESIDTVEVNLWNQFSASPRSRRESHPIDSIQDRQTIPTDNEPPRVRSSHRQLQIVDKTADTFINCRITILNTMLDKNGTRAKGFVSREDFICIPIRESDGRESDNFVAIRGDLRTRLTPNQFGKAKRGHLLASIQRESGRSGSLTIPSDPEKFIVIDKVPSHWANFQQRSSEVNALGKQTLSIVRVSTRDSSPPMSLEAIRLHFSAARRSAAAQYKLCSFSKFQIRFKSAHEVKLRRSIQEFSSGSHLLQAAVTQLTRDLNLGDLTDLADKVVFCLAPGTKGWVATAGVNYFRLVVNGDWCLSLSIAMHELGHTVGLIHSGAGSSPYDDVSGYMGYGNKAIKWPRKCFNALNHWQLRWYEDRHRFIANAKSLNGPNFVTLAAFVDYQKAGPNKEVLLNIENTYYLQYNRAKAFNLDTEENRDKVVVVRDTIGYSKLLKGMSVDEGISLSVGGSRIKLVVKVCHQVEGLGDDPDFVVLSVSMNRAYCGEWHAEHGNR